MPSKGPGRSSVSRRHAVQAKSRQRGGKSGNVKIVKKAAPKAPPRTPPKAKPASKVAHAKPAPLKVQPAKVKAAAKATAAPAVKVERPLPEAGATTAAAGPVRVQHQQAVAVAAEHGTPSAAAPPAAAASEAPAGRAASPPSAPPPATHPPHAPPATPARANVPARPIIGPPPRPPAPPENFAEGDHVVYPTHGVGKVERIVKESIAGYQLELIHITFEENRMTLRVPVEKARSAGLRKLASRPLFEAALATLRGRARIKRTMWSRRAQEYEAKINSGDPLAIAEVVRDLHRNAGQPDQSFSERQIYEAAMDRLAAELAALDKTDKATAADKLSTFLKTTTTTTVVAA